MEEENKNLDKMSRFMAALNGDSLMTKEEFLKSFKNVIDLVLKIEKRNSEAISNLERTYSELVEKIKNNHEINLSDLKKQTNELFVGKQIEKMMKEHIERINAVNEKLRFADEKIKQVKDGYTPIKGKDYFDGKDGVFITNEEIRNKLETLNGENRLSIEAIHGFTEILKQFRNEMEDKIRRSKAVRGMRKVPVVKRENLTSQVDGNTRAFTMPADTVGILGIWGSQSPLNFDNPDWTFSGRTLTLGSSITTPESGQTLFALIEVLFY